MPTPPSAKPASRLSASSQASYEAFYTSASPKVLGWAHTLLRGDGAEDAAQTAWMRLFCVWSTIEALPEGERLRFLITVLRRVVTDVLRHRLSHPGGPPLSLDVRVGEVGELRGEETWGECYLADPAPGPEQVVEALETVEEVLARAGVTGLEALELAACVEGFPVEQVAQMLNQAACDHPTDPRAGFYRQVTPRLIRSRRAKRVASWRSWRQVRSEGVSA